MKMEKEHRKREISPFLKKTLAADVYLTDVFVKRMEKFLPLRQLKVHYKVLEISGHGVLWFAGWLAFIWILSSKDLYQMQVNLFIGLFVDIFLVAIIKATTRRRRPTAEDSPTIGPDKYSFPSGHASRSTFITFFFLYIYPVSFFLTPPFLAWTTSICLSRLLLRKHHILDIIAGVLLGIFEGLLIGMIYLKAETCLGIVSYLSNEMLDGDEYHTT